MEINVSELSFEYRYYCQPVLFKALILCVNAHSVSYIFELCFETKRESMETNFRSLGKSTTVLKPSVETG
ncbi:hypothetical protein SAMN05216369_2491 [Marinobacter antarcticus]|uniref:Uncharacterized protein n=1 Tax=Marinobacter antarcticus TaxID=564117 RepID=A0A1M6TYN0_9GAMM|nr:hypothetical protein SAMN05216369_2491 [Marinobacter antarcticus]